MKVLTRTQFGNLALRKKSKHLSKFEIASPEIQDLIANMRHTLVSKKLGVGLAAPQVGRNLQIAVVAIRPTSLRPNAEPYDLVMVNPNIVEKSIETKDMWEGCISAGSHGEADLFAKVPRHMQLKVTFQDETGQSYTRLFKGLKAQIIQHEVDHLNGILFVDHVKDPKSYMTYKEYLKAKKANKL